MAQGSAILGSFGRAMFRSGGTPASAPSPGAGAPTSSKTFKAIVWTILVLMVVGPTLLIAGAIVSAMMALWCELTDLAPGAECKMQPGEDTCVPGSANMANIPDPWAEVFTAAAAKYQTSPEFLAAIYLSENGNHWKPLEGPWPSNDCCHGPMQFNTKSGTWQDYRVSAKGGQPDIQDAWDSMFSAANMFNNADGLYGPVTKDTPLGSPSNLSEPSMLHSAASYNAGPAGNFNNNETRRYVDNVHALISSNFTEGGKGDYGSYATYPDPYGMGIGAASAEITQVADVQPAANGSDTVKWPVTEGTPIPKNGNFGDRGGEHQGVDFSGGLGEPIFAAADGKVIRAEKTDPDGYGALIEIEHTIDGKMVQTRYAHMANPTEFVKKGDKVTAGQRIASIGQEGNSTGPHLHFEVRPEGGDAIDPIPWLESNGATAGGYTCDTDVEPPDGEPGNWPAERCSVRPDPTTGDGCLTPRTKKVVELMLSQGVSDGQIACFSQRSWGEHPKGRACDVTFGTLGRRASGQDLRDGNRLANYLMENAKTWAIQYVIWQGKIWSTSRYNEGWRKYTTGSCDYTTPTCGHYDHVHVSVY